MSSDLALGRVAGERCRMALQWKDEPSQVERLGQVQKATGHLTGVLAGWEVHRVLITPPLGTPSR